MAIADITDRILSFSQLSEALQAFRGGYSVFPGGLRSCARPSSEGGSGQTAGPSRETDLGRLQARSACVYYHCTGNKGKCTEPYTREEVLDECFADLLKGPVFDDQVMDWIVEALHQSHADEKCFREDAIIRLQEEQSKIQNRLDRLYDDRLDGFIEPDFFERKSREWRQAQK